MPTSTWQALRSQAVAVSGGLPEMLHGVAVLQMITLVIGAAAAGPKLGTAKGPLGAGVVPGLALGDVWGDALGEVFAVGEVEAVPLDDPLRLAMTTPPMPSSRISTTAMIAGISHVGRSDDPRPAGLRATVGMRAGVGAGVGTKRGAGVGAYVGLGAGVGVTEAAPAPAAAAAAAPAAPGTQGGGSAGASTFPGVQVGCSTGVQVDCDAAGGAGNAGGAEAGGFVLVAGDGTAVSNGDRVPAGVNGVGAGEITSGAGAGGLVVVGRGAGGVIATGAAGASYGAGGLAGASDHLGTGLWRSSGGPGGGTGAAGGLGGVKIGAGIPG
jgi:hypothetical protein